MGSIHIYGIFPLESATRLSSHQHLYSTTVTIPDADEDLDGEIQVFVNDSYTLPASSGSLALVFGKATVKDSRILIQCNTFQPLLCDTTLSAMLPPNGGYVAFDVVGKVTQISPQGADNKWFTLSSSEYGRFGTLSCLFLVSFEAVNARWKNVSPPQVASVVRVCGLCTGLSGNGGTIELTLKEIHFNVCPASHNATNPTSPAGRKKRSSGQATTAIPPVSPDPLATPVASSSSVTLDHNVGHNAVAVSSPALGADNHSNMVPLTSLPIPAVPNLPEPAVERPQAPETRRQGKRKAVD